MEDRKSIPTFLCPPKGPESGLQNRFVHPNSRIALLRFFGAYYPPSPAPLSQTVNKLGSFYRHMEHWQKWELHHLFSILLTR